jgi:hypothetical protein
MGKKTTKTRELRQLAEDYVQQRVEEGTIHVSEKSDLVTSLVRQWLTYDDNATLFLREQVYLVLDRSPLGKLRILSQSVPRPWLGELTEEWKIDPQEYPDIIDQLNRGQSADVSNDDGVPLRLWVNPRERTRGVEEPGRRRKPPGWKPNYRALAAKTLQPFSRTLEANELDRLIDSVARQWQQYEGHACLFFQRAMFAFILTETEEGCRLTTKEGKSELEAVLASYDVPPEDIPEMIARINLGQEIDFRSTKGIVCRLWHDPRAVKLCCKPGSPPGGACSHRSRVLQATAGRGEDVTCPLPP